MSPGLPRAALVLAVCAAALAPATTWASGLDEGERVAVFVEPMGTPFFALARAVYVPLGLQGRVSDNVLVTGELAVFSRAPAVRGHEEEDLGTTQLIGSFGLSRAIFTSGNHAIFFGPHLSVLCAFDSTPFGAAGNSVELGLGADIAWQYTWGHLFIGAALGAGAGYAFNGIAGAPTTFGGMALWASSKRSNHATLMVNVNLLRVGFAF